MRDAPACLAKKAIPLKNYLTGETVYDTLHSQTDRPLSCDDGVCHGSNITQWKIHNEHANFCSIDIFKKAQSFLKEFYHTKEREGEFLSRWEDVLCQLKSTGTYDLTFEELEYGVRMGWRNATRCSARIQWQNLVLLDHRHDVSTKDEMFSSICDHIKFGTNGGALRPAVTVFRPRQYGHQDLRVWNGMMLSYAGYVHETTDPVTGEFTEVKIGDQGNLEFTQFCQRLGWKSKEGRFDMLPVVLSDNGIPKYYDIPEELILTVPITHPTIKAIDDMKLQWYALPMVAGMLLEVGGLQFPAAPFAGWYTSVEIATRDLLEPNRYGLLQEIGEALGLDTGTNTSLWKDRVALEMNAAILHSFAKSAATIVDQHTVSEQFQSHYESELRVRGGCPTDWVWVTPSQSGSLTPVYHQETLHYHLSPSFEKQILPWTTYRFPEDGEKRQFKLRSIFMAALFAMGLYKAKRSHRPTIKIFYATETGTAKRYAKRLEKMFTRTFNVRLLEFSQFDKGEKSSNPEEDNRLTGLCLFISSTFGNGDPPGMAESMAEWLDHKLTSNDVEKLSRLGLKEDLEDNPELPVFDEEATEQPVKLKPVETKQRRVSVMSRHNKTLFRRISIVERLDLSSLKFGVFALGSSAYPHFCGFGKWLDLALNRLDGSRLLPIGLGDELGDRDGTFMKWANAALNQACVDSGIEDLPKSLKAGDGADIEGIGITVTRWKAMDNVHKETFDTITKDLSAQNDEKITRATLTSRRHLTKDQYNTILVRLEMDKPAKYEPGDHIAIYPVNQDVDVDLILSHMSGLPGDPNQVVVQLQEQQEQSGWGAVSSGLPAATIRRLLKHHLSVKTTPSQDMLRQFVDQAENDKEKERLKLLATDYKVYSEWRKDEPSVADTFRAFSSLRVDSAQLVSLLAPMRQRFYSIASCQQFLLDNDTEKRLPNSIHVDLLVTVVEYTTPRGMERKGLCSNYLLEAPLNSQMAVYLRPAPNFHLPKVGIEPDVPLVLIGAGSGLAPFRGFWQQVCLESECQENKGVLRRVMSLEKSHVGKRSTLVGKKARHNRMQLFYGCWDQGSDLLRNETDPLAPEILTRHTAYSREKGQEKQYVQDLVRKNGIVIYTALVQKRGRVYVCGKVAMAEEVNNAIVEVIADVAKIPLDVAADIVHQMKDEGRYSQDIFGQ